MTIGIGYLGRDYVFLGADMEITKNAKHKAGKHFVKWFNKETAIVAAV